jgi:translation elongation factor TU
METYNLNLVITGHVDHGKSTFIGRLLYDLGVLTAEKMAIVAAALKTRGAAEFAHITDSFEEERLLGMTMDTSDVVFEHAGRKYTLSDVPGHYELLAKMVTGAHQADAAILIVDAKEGMQRQTKLHCHLLSMMGIRQMVVLINKMDAVSYSKDVFDKSDMGIYGFLKGMGIESVYSIPVSALYGDNIFSLSNNMPWYNGPSVVPILATLKPRRSDGDLFCFPVQDVYEIDRERIVVGRVEAGTIYVGQKLRMLPDSIPFVVKAIKKYSKDNIGEAGTGECIGVMLKGGDISGISRGNILSDSENLKVDKKVKARIFWLTREPCRVDEYYSVCCATQSVKGKVTGISGCLQVSTDNQVVYSESVDNLLMGEIADIDIELESPIVFQASGTSALGHIVIKRDGVIITGGGSLYE